MITALEFQKRAKEQLTEKFLNLWKNEKRQLPLVFQSPTGSGKTFMVSSFIRGLNSLPQWDVDKSCSWVTFSDDLAMQSKDKFQNLFETMAQGVVYQDSEGKIISANPAAERILGLSLDQMMGRTSIDKRWKSIHEDGSDFPGKEHPSMLALKTAKEVKDVVMGVFHPKENIYKWILINAIPQFRSNEKQPCQVYATFEDITTLKEQQAVINRERDLLDRILENSPIGKLVLNNHGHITYANKIAELIMGVRRKEIEKRTYNDLKWKITDIDGNSIPENKLPFNLIMQSQKEIRNYALSITDEKGKARFINIHGSPMFCENADFDGVVFSIEQINYEEALTKKTWKDF